MKFQNFTGLTSDMRANGWIIDSFLFRFHGVDAIVLIKLFPEKNFSGEAEIEFYRIEDAFTVAGTIDSNYLSLESATAAYKFWGVELSEKGRNFFQNLEKMLAKSMPMYVSNQKTALQKNVMCKRLEQEDSEYIYLNAVIRLGIRNGHQDHRSAKRDNKARLLREDVYEIYGGDTTITFRFSKSPYDEKSLKQIMLDFAAKEGKRKE